MIFFYDVDCGFCRRAAQRLQRYAPLIGVASLPLRHHAIYRCAGEDELGHRAIGAALRDGGGAWWAQLAGRVLLLRPLDRLWSVIYRLVAANRSLVARLVGQ
ncbi:MAG: hypothetical protein Q4G50_11140 [Corynebacterium sp.]|uniref:hypothetical protein n=1 Tax=Corynebacterium sp. TaxID=1720 RepID=UPI0026DF95B1|nr:hypothetical protein [Corynebacterium sp.]MDO5670546.1 hypothetical protein [Corynebacterium sp.]